MTREEIKGHVNDWRGDLVQENIDTTLLIIAQEGIYKGAGKNSLAALTKLKSRHGLALGKMKNGFLSLPPTFSRVPLYY